MHYFVFAVFAVTCTVFSTEGAEKLKDQAASETGILRPNYRTRQTLRSNDRQTFPADVRFEYGISKERQSYDRNRITAPVIPSSPLGRFESTGGGGGGISTDPRCELARGQSSHPENCALYYNCWDEIVLLELCPNGLVFDALKRYCDYPENVNCGPRTATEPPISTTDCPILWGLFRGPDCTTFYNCVDGVAFEVSCPPGLAFNEPTKSCEYPEKVPGCENILPFQCPAEYGRHPAGDQQCKQFWLCIDGNARLLSCDPGKKFDSLTRKCADEHIATC